MLIRIALAAVLVAVGVSAVVAQQDPIAARKALMKLNGQHGAALSKILKGEEPFDAAKVEAGFAQWADTAAKFSALFPDSSKTGETRAAAAIWTDRAGFDAAVAKFAKDVADNRAKAATLDGLKAAMPIIGKNCSDCHQAFRNPS